MVQRTFGGLLRSDVTCRACGHTSTAFDPFLDLSLDLPPQLPAPQAPLPPGPLLILPSLTTCHREDRHGLPPSAWPDPQLVVVGWRSWTAGFWSPLICQQVETPPRPLPQLLLAAGAPSWT